MIANHGFNQMTQTTLNHLSAAQYYNDEAEKSWLGTESVAKYIRDNPVSAGVSLSTLIVILSVARVTLKFLKKRERYYSTGRSQYQKGHCTLELNR